MQLFRDLTHLPERFRGGVIALGNFDGVHLGHQAVIGTAMKLAQEASVPAAVLTFSPHPRAFFAPGQPPLRIYPLHVKLELLRGMGIDALFLQRFNAAFAALSPAEFIARVLHQALRARHVVTGEDFVFGKGRAGNAQMLAQGQPFGFTCVPTLRDESGEACSSTRIRALLGAGKMSEAAQLLGRPYRLEGRVLHGDARGRTLGFPTANLRLPPVMPPAFGVYAVRVQLPGGEWVKGVANLGIRPTFEADAPLLEVHCFNLSQELYGMRLRVELVRHLRPERRFAGLEELKAQIERDCTEARSILDSRP